MLAPFIVIFILYRMSADMDFKSFILSGWYPFNYFGDTLKVIFYGGSLFFIGMFECFFAKVILAAYRNLKISKENHIDKIIKYDSYGEIDQDLTKLYEICKVENHTNSLK